ncbi:hypothetical protein FA95DRAFT_1613738 [Auriscalpium vulgare]|uniref:Uncharacterized protein n=1 Tax=Auriscalpium vulgare TaxID=40419 RepID=A0ACB8R1H9_9AGAM|nr:hypothetical protein FA95DRAFT_1613738 [Auriscalpium vulgare]
MPGGKKKEKQPKVAVSKNKGPVDTVTVEKPRVSSAAAAAANTTAKVAAGEGAAKGRNLKVAAARETPAGRAKATATKKRKTADADVAAPAAKKRKGAARSLASGSDAVPVDSVPVINVSESEASEREDEGTPPADEDESVSDVVPEDDEVFGAVDASTEADGGAGQAAAAKPRGKGKKALDVQFEVAIPRWTSEAVKPKALTEASAPAHKAPKSARMHPTRGPPRARLRVDSESDEEEDSLPANHTQDDNRHVTPLDGSGGAPEDDPSTAASPPASLQASSAADKGTEGMPSVAASRAVSVSSASRAVSVSAASRAVSVSSAGVDDSDGTTMKSQVEVVPAQGGSKIKIRAQPATVTKVIQHANKHAMPEFICFKNAFPTQIERPPLLRQALLDAAKALGHVAIENKLREDPEYADSMARITDGRISNLRGKVKLVADQCVMNAYELTTIPAARFVRHIHRLTDPQDHPRMYTYPSNGAAANERFDTSRPYCHPAIITVLHNSFFGTKAAVRFNEKKYQAAGTGDKPELPIAMVALASTAVYVALDCYSLGSQPTHLEFEANKYTGVYLEHVDVLEQIRLDNPVKFSALMAHLFKAASCVFPLFVFVAVIVN